MIVVLVILLCASSLACNEYKDCILCVHNGCFFKDGFCNEESGLSSVMACMTKEHESKFNVLKIKYS